jgi:hypothetical protein
MMKFSLLPHRAMVRRLPKEQNKFSPGGHSQSRRNAHRQLLKPMPPLAGVPLIAQVVSRAQNIPAMECVLNGDTVIDSALLIDAMPNRLPK